MVTMLRKRFLFIMLAALVTLSAKGGKPVRICVEAAQGDATRLLQQAIGQASDLTAGMYIYSLVVDGQVKVTRRMMVSEK